MKFTSALALPALFLGALAAPVEKRQVVDVANITSLVTDLLADVLPLTAAISMSNHQPFFPDLVLTFPKTPPR